MNETILIALVGSTAAIIGALSNALVNRHQAVREDKESEQERIKQKKESDRKLEAFEDKMLIDLATKYQGLVNPLELRIERLEQELREQREFYQNLLQERDLEVAALKSQLEQYDARTTRQRNQIHALQNEIKTLIRKIRILEAKDNG